MFKKRTSRKDLHFCKMNKSIKENNVNENARILVLFMAESFDLNVTLENIPLIKYGQEKFLVALMA